MKHNSLNTIEETTVSHNPVIKKQVMIAPGEIPAITNFSRAVFPPGEIANAHAHNDMTEVFLIESGQGIMTVDNQDYAMNPGDCITVHPHETHELKNTGNEPLSVIYFGVET